MEAYTWQEGLHIGSVARQYNMHDDLRLHNLLSTEHLISKSKKIPPAPNSYTHLLTPCPQIRATVSTLTNPSPSNASLIASQAVGGLPCKEFS